MYYKLNDKINNTGNYVQDILLARGIDDIEKYLNPTKEDLLPAKEIKNIDEGVKLLLRHLNNNSKIYVVVD